jgi:hypothetical protein
MQQVVIVMRVMRSRVLGAAMWIAAICSPALAHTPVRSNAGSGQPTPHSALFADCTDATVRDIRLPYRASVDQIRVILAGENPGEAPVRVEVSTGRSVRSLLAAGAPGRVLRFSPGLEGDHFQVSLDPSFSGSTSACVARVELVADGHVVAAITP